MSAHYTYRINYISTDGNTGWTLKEGMGEVLGWLERNKNAIASFSVDHGIF